MTRLISESDNPQAIAVGAKTMCNGTVRPDLVNQVVHAIYQSVLEVDPWRSCLVLTRDLFQSLCALVVVRPSSALDLGYLVCEPSNPAVEYAYRTHWYQLDPFLDLPPEQPMLMSDLLSEQQWRATAFYREYMGQRRSIGANHILGVNVVTRAGTVSRIRLYRLSEDPAFTADDKALLATLVPHIKQAMTLAAHVNRKESERELYEEALDRLKIGVVVLDETGQLLRANPTACCILSNADGLRLVDRRLEGCSNGDTRELQRLISGTQADPASVHAISLTRPSGRRKLGAVVRAIPLVEESEGRARPAWAVFLRDPDAHTSAPRDILRQLFDFTPAESALAIKLADGLSLDECAEKLGIRRNTARAHLRSIFVKSGVSRQTELVRVLLNGVIGLTAGAESTSPAPLAGK